MCHHRGAERGGGRRGTTHAVPFPLEQKHYPHNASGYARYEAHRGPLADRRSISFSLLPDPSLFLYSLLVIASAQPSPLKSLLYTPLARSALVEKVQTIRSKPSGRGRRATEESKASGRGPRRCIERKHDSLTGLWRSKSPLPPGGDDRGRKYGSLLHPATVTATARTLRRICIIDYTRLPLPLVTI